MTADGPGISLIRFNFSLGPFLCDCRASWRKKFRVRPYENHSFIRFPTQIRTIHRAIPAMGMPAARECGWRRAVPGGH